MVSRRTDIANFKDSELLRWNVPKELEGRVLDNPQELKKLFPESNGFGAIIREQDGELVRYKRSRIAKPRKEGESEYSSGVYIAYKRPNGKIIVVSSLEIR